jgi:hypothetical protein
MSVGADRVFNVSDTHLLAFPAREGDTDWPRCSTLCMYLYLVPERTSLSHLSVLGGPGRYR